MTVIAPAPLTVRPGTRVLMDTLVQATASIPVSYQPDLPELAAAAWRLCRGVGHPVTIAELAARLEFSPALTGVLVCDLAQLDLVRIVRFPALAARLRSWACDGPTETPVPQLAKLLIVGDNAEDVRQCLMHLTGADPLCLDGSARVDVTVARVAEDLHLLALGAALDAEDPSWTDLCRDAFGALVVTDPLEPDRAARRVAALNAFGVPLAVLVPAHDSAEPTPGQIRMAVGLSDDVPVVIADLDSPAASTGGLMDLCTYLENGGHR
ncbi:DUF742 domain-containing protein [Nocardiopsis quinghaiensis]|uniref:DUF742 domain-containing protein n=1 Tax=Nocardiopsis quinghaiensis TaxID=464995 RepID=UPI00123B1A46|nr:DUF742 domain-containing protein [Nocardiopsis quinghaiensis]